jgi:ACT domain-containing protein
MSNNSRKSIQKRIDTNKKALLKQLKQTPIVQVACSKAGLSRATFYRWRKEDTEFSNKVDEALSEGKLFINDMAESKLVSAIQDENLTAIIYWLKNHHWDYREKLEVTAKHSKFQKLTPEQEKIIAEALAKGSLLQADTKKTDSNE